MKTQLGTFFQVLVGHGLLFSLNPVYSYALNAEYSLGAETHLSRSVVTPQVFPILSLGVNAESVGAEYANSPTEEYKIDAKLRISPNHPKAFAITSKNLYFGDVDQSYESPLRFSYGRKYVGWSKLDTMWGLGEFEPLDSWDRMRASPQGLTGVFAYTETQSFTIRFFLSYIAIPEIQPNVVIENNAFVLEHPQAISTAPQTYTLLNRPTPLGYELVIPDYTRILLRPSFAFSFETRREYDLFFKFAYGYLPLNYFPVALQASLAIPLDQIVVKLHPRLLHHHLFSGEAAYRFSDSFSGGVGILGNQVIADTMPDDYTGTPLGTSYTFSPWIQYEQPQFQLTASHLITKDGLKADVGPYADPNNSIFSSRVLYRNASLLKVRYFYSTQQKNFLEAKYIHEFAVQGDWIAADAVFFVKPNLSLTVGGDLINAQKTAAPDRGAEFLADIRAIDRIRVGVQYVF